jgi:hypothetical protein
VLEHLVNISKSDAADILLWDKADPDAIVEAQMNTADWLDEMEAQDSSANAVANALEVEDARTAFSKIVGANLPSTQRSALARLKAPAAVQHLVGMLSAYDWEFVEQARELRGYAVAKIVEETKSPDSRIRLKALDMLGKVTEVGLFTNRVELVDSEKTAEQIEDGIRARLAKYLPPTLEVETVVPREAQDELLQQQDMPSAP